MRTRTAVGVVALSLLAITLLAYLPALSAGFVWDDDGHVTGNATLADPAGLLRIWFEIGATQQYYPLVFSSFWLEHRLWGADPAGYHAVNVLLHALNAFLVWRVALRLRIAWPLVLAVLFAVHPVHVESVAWISERKNVLSGAMYLGAMLAWLRWAGYAVQGDEDGWGRRRDLALAFVLFVAALFAKTVTCSLPAALALVVWWKHGTLRRAEALTLVPMLVLGAALAALTVWVEHEQIGARGAEWALAPAERVVIAGRALWFYAGKLAFPTGLCFSYPRWDVDAAALTAWVAPLTVLAVLGALWTVRGRVGRGPLVAVLFFAGTALPALGFVDVYPMRYTFVADHYVYLASLGLFALAVGAVGRAATSKGLAGAELVPGVPRSAAIAAAAVAVVLAPLTHAHARAFESSETLYRDVLAKNPTSWLAHQNLGRELLIRGRLDEAARELRAALALVPEAPEVHASLGIVEARRGAFEPAIAHFEDALALDPGDALALDGLGIALASTGAVERAIDVHRRAVAAAPERAAYHANLANALAAAGRYEEAADAFDASLERDPTDPRTHYNLATLLEDLGQRATALEHYREALRLAPAFEPARAALARLGS